MSLIQLVGVAVWYNSTDSHKWQVFQLEGHVPVPEGYVHAQLVIQAPKCSVLW